MRVLLLNTDRTAPFEIAVGDRIAQLVITDLPAVEFAEAESLSETVRGAGGLRLQRRRLAPNIRS